MTPLSATERVELLLRTFNEARVTYTIASTGNGVRLMPAQWNEGSYAELERRLIVMRESKRSLWWHISQRYRWGVERLIVCPIVRRIRGPEFLLPANCELIAGGPSVGTRVALARVYQWRVDVDEGKAREGVAHLTASMYDGRADRIYLPLLVLRRRLGLPIEGERELVA